MSSTGCCATRIGGSARTRPATWWPRSGPITRPLAIIRLEPTGPSRAAEKAKKLAAVEQAQRRASEEVQAQDDKARETKLRAAWERLPEADREAIQAAVKAENPGLGRWKNMLEPLCLAALEARMNESAAAQRLLFPDVATVK